MKYTNSDFKNLNKNYQDFLGSSTNLIEAIKERDKRIEELKLQLETINKPFEK